MVSLHLLGLYLAQVRGTMSREAIGEMVDRILELPGQVERALRLDEEVSALAERFADARDFLFLGRHTGYPAALEGALKLKELSYIPAQGYPGHTQSLVLGAALLVVSVQLWLIGLLADLIAANRRLLEEVLYKQIGRAHV
jgi:glucosamine 6-phosphate synthetase-like amidotransferase/phosphosugar isomerase protein